MVHPLHHRPYYVGKPVTPEYIRRLYEWYDLMQKKSEEVLAGYVQRASLPLTPVNPKNPPTSMRIDPPPTPPKPDPVATTTVVAALTTACRRWTAR